ncbi:MAG: nucleotidyltransferase domain-containing protein [Candidatus Bathyarchaeota archaeon]
MDARRQVAYEAARLLYDGAYDEYKDAKEVAATSLGVRSIPSNYEVAEQLERVAEAEEGSDRLRRLMEMRMVAVEVMKALGDVSPRLIGSVWRGTARMGSDVDVVVYGDHDLVELTLSEKYSVKEKTAKSFMVEGAPRTSTHLKLEVGGYDVEVVVRPPRDVEAYRDERCDIYGDFKRGVGLGELERLMKTDPLRRFIPRRRQR